MIEYSYIGDGSGLRKETKISWERGTLDNDTLFIHGSSIGPRKINLFGINPLYANEYLIDPDGHPIGSGKMIFAFKSVALTHAPANAHKRSRGATLLFGEAHAYVFKAPSGTVFYSRQAECSPSCEIAFPYIVESDDIEFYIPPKSNENVPWSRIASQYANDRNW